MKKTSILLMFCVSAFTAMAQWSVDSLINICANDVVSTYQQKTMFVNYGGWELYDLQTGNSVTGTLSLGRNTIQVATVNNIAYFGGGQYGPFTDPVYTNNVDVYDFLSNTWSLKKLSKAREVGAAASVGNKLLFAGGRDALKMYNTVDIFDATTGIRTIAKLSKARTNISVAVNGNKVVFAGGWFFDFNYNRPTSNAVDIFDISTGVWTTATLSQKRQGMAVASVGTKILFAGGLPNSGVSNRVDIYDVMTNAWSTATLSAARYGMTVNVIGSKAYFASGNGASNKIDVYNAANNTWSVIIMPYSLVSAAGAAVNGQLLYAGGYDPLSFAVSNALQVYNTTTNSWTTGTISEARAGSNVVTIANTALFAGGYTKVTYPAIGSRRIDIYTATTAAFAKTNMLDFTVFPNPVISPVQFTAAANAVLPITIHIYNDGGNIVATYRVMNKSEKLNLNMLPVGKYMLSACDANNNCASKLILKQ